MSAAGLLRGASPGLWTLAWRRMRRDTVGMVALCIVAAFALLVLASAAGVVAGDWAAEVGVNYAPPGFVGADHATAAPAAMAVRPARRRRRRTSAARS